MLYKEKNGIETTSTYQVLGATASGTIITFSGILLSGLTSSSFPLVTHLSCFFICVVYILSSLQIPPCLISIVLYAPP